LKPFDCSACRAGRRPCRCIQIARGPSVDGRRWRPQQKPLGVVAHPWRGDDFDFFSRSATLRASTDRFVVRRGLSLFSSAAKQRTRHRGVLVNALKS
jgi:hypothetical protein